MSSLPLTAEEWIVKCRMHTASATKSTPAWPDPKWIMWTKARGIQVSFAYTTKRLPPARDSPWRPVQFVLIFKVWGWEVARRHWPSWGTRDRVFERIRSSWRRCVVSKWVTVRGSGFFMPPGLFGHGRDVLMILLANAWS